MQIGASLVTLVAFWIGLSRLIPKSSNLPLCPNPVAISTSDYASVLGSSGYCEPDGDPETGSRYRGLVNNRPITPTLVAEGILPNPDGTVSGPNGETRIFINGALVQRYNGPCGNISYPVGRSAAWANEPYLVIGAEKHNYDPTSYPSFSGWVDEVRICNVVRSAADFTPPNAPFTADANTVGLYHLDKGCGNAFLDTSGAPGGPSHGERRGGGPNNGPVYDALTKRF